LIYIRDLGLFFCVLVFIKYTQLVELSGNLEPEQVNLLDLSIKR